MSVTINLWHIIIGLLVYLGLGVLTFIPIYELALRGIAPPRPSRREEGKRLLKAPHRIAIQVACWPAALWEVL